jgi:hypothetical protein
MNDLVRLSGLERSDDVGGHWTGGTSSSDSGQVKDGPVCK